MSARNGAKKRGAQPRQSGGGGGKRWPFFVGGLLSGLLIAAGVYLLKILPTAMELRARAQAEAAACAEDADNKGGNKRGHAAANAEGKAGGDKPVTFEFYSMLPRQEVVAPVNGSQTTTATPPPMPTGTEKPPGTTSAVEPQFLLQAGSFRTRAEADRRRGELVLSGHNANVQEGKTANGITYRVMVGPFNGETGMQKARQQLAAQKIDTFPVRLK